MERITEKLELGTYSIKGLGSGAIQRLGEYEDTGLTPEQIVDMDVMYRKKCEEVAKMSGFALVSENDRLRRRNASLEIQIKKLEEQLKAKENS